MPSCGRGMRGSRGRGGRCYSRVSQDVMVALATYRHQILAHIQEEIKDIEEEMKLERYYIVEEEVDLSENVQILDLGTSGGRDPKQFRTMDLYWHTKIVMGCTLVSQNKDHREFLLQLDVNKWLENMCTSNLHAHSGMLPELTFEVNQGDPIAVPFDIEDASQEASYRLHRCHEVFFQLSCYCFFNFCHTIINNLKIESTILIGQYGLVSLLTYLKDIDFF